MDRRKLRVPSCEVRPFTRRPRIQIARAAANEPNIELQSARHFIFGRDAFERVLEDHARTERLLLQRTLAALGVARARILSLAREPAQEKIAGFLLDMALRATASGCRATLDGPITFDLPLTRGQIADVLGLTIETVSRQMTRLKIAGVIALPGGRAITISNESALQDRAEAA
jgi:CRP/FNR family transcriptional regulator